MTQQLGTGVVPEWTVGDRLRKAREVVGLEAQQLAEEIDVHRDTVANYEKGRVRPRVIVLKAWALRTGVSLDWLQNGESPRQPKPTGTVPLPRRGGVRHQGLEPRTRCVTHLRPANTIRERMAA